MIRYLVFFCCGMLMLQQQGTYGMRIKRDSNHTAALSASLQLIKMTPISSTEKDSTLPKATTPTILKPTLPGLMKNDTKNTTNTNVGKHNSTATLGTPINATTTSLSGPATTATPTTAVVLHAAIPKMLGPLSIDAHPHHAKRRMALLDDMPPLTHRHRRHGKAGAQVPPYVYYNKLVSPDGKQQLKEFELVAPNMMIESVQQEMNYGPDAMPLSQSGQDLDGVLIINTDGNLLDPMQPLQPRKHGRHHRKHKSLPPISSSNQQVAPMLYMLQQLLQTQPVDALVPLEIPLEKEIEVKPHANNRHQADSPLYQFIDRAVDLALHKNDEEIKQRLALNVDGLNDMPNENGARDEENFVYRKSNGKELKKKMDEALYNLFNGKTEPNMELMPSKNDDELLLSCPVHHEHRIDHSGAMVDDDIVVVNECHLA